MEIIASALNKSVAVRVGALEELIVSPDFRNGSTPADSGQGVCTSQMCDGEVKGCKMWIEW